MEIVKVTAYEDRGLLRRRIEWRDGETTGIADTHCAITGAPLGPNYTRCVIHCQRFGHYSADVNTVIKQRTKDEISEQDMLALFLSWSRYPDDQPMVE